MTTVLLLDATSTTQVGARVVDRRPGAVVKDHLLAGARQIERRRTAELGDDVAALAAGDLSTPPPRVTTLFQPARSTVSLPEPVTTLSEPAPAVMMSVPLPTVIELE